MINTSSWKHHPAVIATNSKLATKLPFGHTREERISELKEMALALVESGLNANSVVVAHFGVENMTDEEYAIRTTMYKVVTDYMEQHVNLSDLV